MVILLSLHRNIPIHAICLLLNRNNRYTRSRHAMTIANNARTYSSIKDLGVGEARVIEETGRFLESYVKIKNALAWLKKKRSIKCEKLGGFLQSTTFVSFKKMMEYL